MGFYFYAAMDAPQQPHFLLTLERIFTQHLDQKARSLSGKPNLGLIFM